MCCAREKAFCVDDRELMMFLCRWNDSLMCCLIDNANDKMFFGVPGAKREWPLSLDIRIHAIANANGHNAGHGDGRRHACRVPRPACSPRATIVFDTRRYIMNNDKNEKRTTPSHDRRSTPGTYM